jgi:hypothetical protein
MHHAHNNSIIHKTGAGFLLSKRHVSTDVCWGHQQPTVISMVHEVAVGAALAVWVLRICGVTHKLPVAISKLLIILITRCNIQHVGH